MSINLHQLLAIFIDKKDKFLLILFSLHIEQFHFWATKLHHCEISLSGSKYSFIFEYVKWSISHYIHLIFNLFNKFTLFFLG